MNKCKNCKHWSNGKKEIGENFELEPGMPENYRICFQDNYECVEGPPTGIAYRSEDENWDWFIYTGPDFGCVNFKERNSE